jgi:hypothetical protein
MNGSKKYHLQDFFPSSKKVVYGRTNNIYMIFFDLRKKSCICEKISSTWRFWMAEKIPFSQLSSIFEKSRAWVEKYHIHYVFGLLKNSIYTTFCNLRKKSCMSEKISFTWRFWIAEKIPFTRLFLIFDKSRVWQKKYFCYGFFRYPKQAVYCVYVRWKLHNLSDKKTQFKAVFQNVFAVFF